MAKTEIKSIEALRRRIGEEIAVSDWLTISQERIDKFADATDDRQWVHTEPARAAQSPFGGTIAHGFLTLSLIPRLMADALTFPPAQMTINYGLNRARFTAPVRAGGRVRARFVLLALRDMPGCVQLTWKVSIEAESSGKPACIAEMVVRRYES